MKIEDVERIIQSSLEDRSREPAPGVPDAVKREMRKTPRKKNRGHFAGYAAAACLAAICLVLAIALPVILLKPAPNDYMRSEYSSMQDYVSSEGIDIRPFSQFLDDGILDVGEGNAIEAIGCQLIKLEDTQVVCVEEICTFVNGRKIVMSVLLTDDERIEKDLFPGYESLQGREAISDTTVWFSFTENIGKARFSLNGYKVYFLFETDTEKEMLSYLRTFIENQN